MSRAIPAAAFILLMLAAGPAPALQSNDGNPTEYYLGGQPDAPVKIEVFSDFQCPACRMFFLETIQPVLRDYASNNRVCVVYHDFPLSMHSHAREATRYAVAARRIGREQALSVSEALYMNQSLWAESGNIEQVLSRVLSPEDMAKLKEMIKDPEIDRKIDTEVALANERGVRSTPTFFVHALNREQKVVGGVSYPVLKDFLDRIVR